MKSLKEQREKLFQEKLAEMADIGVKKRTGENTPDFDDPIDLDDDSDSVEEDASASLSKIDEQEEIPEETSFNGNNAKRKAATHGCEDGKCKVVVGFRHGRCGFLACGFYFIFDLSFLLRCEILLVELFVVHVFNVVGDCCYTSMCMSPLSAHAAFLFVYRAFVFCFLARRSYLV